MKKILAIAIVAVLTVALCASASALVHTSADQVMAGSDGHDLAGFGGNDKDGTELGTITESSFFAWGWYSTECEGGITEFGYRYGDNVTLGSEKFIGGDADVIASQCGGVGESCRFKIEIPVVKGNDVEVYAVAKLADGTVEDIWRIVYTSEQGAEAPAETPAAEKGEDQWLCGADPEGATNTGWWFNPVGEPDDRYVEVHFTATSSFKGVHGFYYCSNEANDLPIAHMTVELLQGESKVGEAELASSGDAWADIDFGKSFPAGDYTLRYTCKSGSGIENNCWCVIGCCAGSGDVTVEANVADTSAGAYPALMLIGADGGSQGGSQGGTTPRTADASVIAVAAVACVALAGIVIAKKVR